jgi:hypothetical protein
VRPVNKLNEAKNVASPWQKAAIERINPYLGELNGYTSAVIEHINRDPAHTPVESTDYLEANADYATELAAMIENFVDYAKTKQRLERLAAKVEIRPVSD